MRKLIIFVGLVMVILFPAACSGTSEPPVRTEAEKPSDTVGDSAGNSEKDLPQDGQEGEENGLPYKDLLVREYKSPEGTSKILMYAKLSEAGEGIPYSFKTVTDGMEKEIGEQLRVYEITDPVVWLDDKRAVVGGQWLYDTETRNISYILPERDYLYTYAFSPDRKYLAVCGKSEYEGRFGMEIRLINLDDFSDQKVFAFPAAEVWTSGISFSLAWLDEETFFFDGNLDEKPAIFKYSLKTGKTETFVTQAWYPRTYPGGRYVSYMPLTDYYDNESGEETVIRRVYGGEEARIPYPGQVHWIDRDKIMIFSEGLKVYLVGSDLSYTQIGSMDQQFITLLAAQREKKHLTIDYWNWVNGVPVADRKVVELDL